MSCSYRKSSLVAVNTTAQNLTINNFVSLVELNKTGRNIQFNGGIAPIKLLSSGIYLIDVTANLLGTAAGIVTLQLLNNGNTVQGATASVTTAIGDAYNVHLATLIEIPPSCICSSNVANLQLQLQTTDVTISNINVSVVKLE